jgi:hypothetical protein
MTGAAELGSITRLIRERPPRKLQRLADSTVAVTAIVWLPAALAAAGQTTAAAAKTARSFNTGLRVATCLACTPMLPENYGVTSTTMVSL